MRDPAKVAIGLGSVWGLYAFVAMLLNSLNFGPNNTMPDMVAIVVYGLTFLPSCILAVWFPKPAAYWLIALSPLTAAGLLHEIMFYATSEKAQGNYTADIWTAIFLASIPLAFGIALFITRDRTD